MFVILGGLCLGLLGAGSYFLFSKNSTNVVSPKGADANVTPTAAPKMLSWDDPAGFTVSYPEGLIMNKHDEDAVNYAHVEFTSPGKPGSMIIWVKDIPPGVSDTGTWVKKDASLSAGSALDTTLGGQAAQKILLATSPKKEIIGSVYDNALFYIEVALDDGGFWQSTTDSMVQSFVFKPINTQAGTSDGNSGSPGDSLSVDEEEVLQ